MNEQISTIQTREVLELMRNLAPILNQKELFEFMLFSNRVLKRYMPEYYNDGLSEEVTEMRKDKAWLKEELLEELMQFNDNPNMMTSYETGIADGIATAINLTEKLDKQELTQREVDKWLDERDMVAVDTMMVHQTEMQNKVVVGKPVIPQFVADYIEKWEHEGLTIYEWFSFGNNDVDEDIEKWLYDNTIGENTRREYLLFDAIRFGYKVEKEKRYFIIEPVTGQLLIRDDSQSRGVKWADGFSTSPSYFTEKEIKAIDERYWVFAEEATE